MALVVAAIIATDGLLANAESIVTFELNVSKQIRQRPSVVWPVIGVLSAGEEVTATAVTPKSDAWLRVEQGGSELGWIQTADAATDVDKIVDSLPVETAPPLWAFVRGTAARMSEWAGGTEVTFSLDDPVLSPQIGPFGVFGRSADSKWLAVEMPRVWGAARLIGRSWNTVRPQIIVWFRAADMILSDSRLATSDLPIFIGNGTTLIPTEDNAGLQPRHLPPANEWTWRSDGLLIGIGDTDIWRYDPQNNKLAKVGRPAGLAALAPDGRHLAVAVCNNWNRSCQTDKRKVYEMKHDVYDIVIVPTDGGAWSRSLLTGSYPGGYKFGLEYDVGVWSPDSSSLLVPRIRTGQDSWAPVMEYSVVTLTGARYYLPGSCRWQWIWDGSLLDCQGDRYSPAPERQLLQEGIVPPRTNLWLLGRSHLTYPWVPPHVPLWSEDHGCVALDPLTGALNELQVPNNGLSLNICSRSWDHRSRDGLRAWQHLHLEEVPSLVWIDLLTGETRTMQLPDDDFSRRGYSAIVPVIPTTRRMLWGSANEEGQVSLYISESDEEPRLVSRFTQDLGYGDFHAIAIHGQAGWSREAQQLAIIVREDEVMWPNSVRVDGLFTNERGTGEGGAQIRIHNLDGEFATAIRTLARINYWTGIRADWSPDGHWLTVGGHSLGSFWRATHE